ncbi:mechanosensitive ion channel protein [Caballeronia arationis]|uniref:Small-conductance mechanosensitive channel n=1 Tax=Caballeronia arationis TaxID=1777142 RepID=A0A7Z7I4Y9_9BURK|nr:mechanosensitive ion channel domain-containing protein [Caballeronia arationis]SAL01062.1 mechanosensitive ion channel protein [Caballeronia arationis]SOE63216.1 Mechanosensitive ion channel [Caballeronia arationis]
MSTIVRSISMPARGLAALLMALACLLVAPGAGAQPAASAPVAASGTVAPAAELEFMNRPIATLRATLGAVDPASRVENARVVLSELPEDALGAPVTTLAGQMGANSGVMFYARTHPLFAYAREDTLPASGSFEAQVATVESNLNTVLEARRQQMHWPNLVRGALLSVIAFAVLLALMWIVARLRSRVHGRLSRVLEKHILQRTSSKFDWTGSAVQLTSQIVQLLAVFLMFSLAYVWLIFALDQFPLTAPLGRRMSGFLLRLLTKIGLGALSAIPGLVTIVVIFLLTRGVQTLLRNVFDSIQRQPQSFPGLHPETVGATRRLLGAVVWAIAITFAYPYIPGSQSDVFKGLSVLFGFMLTLGSTSVVNQMMSGMVLVYSRALRKGDMVRIGAMEGQVMSVDALSVKLVNPSHEEVTLPNSLVVNSPIQNFSRLADERGARIGVSVTIGYDASWRHVHAMLEAAALKTPHIRPDPAPFVMQRSLSDFYVEYQLIAALDDPARRPYILSDLNANIQDEFNAAGVQIMSPHFQTQPDEPVFVPKENWFTPPATKG